MDRRPDNAERITLADARARLGGAVLLVAVGYAHLLDLSHKIDEGVWYMALAFVCLIVAAIGIALLLVRSPAISVRLAWVAAAALSAGALLGYTVSRLVPLPGLADHAGEWISTYGVLAFLAEVGLIALAGFAMRDLTVRGVPHEAPGWIRGTTAGLWPAAPIAAAAVVSMPNATALAHGGEEDEGAAGSASALATGGGDASGTAASAPTGHGDPFLGSLELSVALLLSLAFLAWAARDLFGRAALGARQS